MKFLNKLERRFGKLAIPNLINYIIILYVLGTFLGIIAPGFYKQFLMLDVEKILQGQVWRLVTFIIEPYALSQPFDILFFALLLYLYYMFGHSLENAWGAFRFNLYFISGMLFSVLAAFIMYFTVGWGYPVGLSYIYQSMFFAFAALYPNMQFLLFFLIPVKVKYLAYLDAALMIFNIITYLRYGIAGYPYAIAIVVAMANFLIFFLATRNYKRISPKEQRRKARYKMQVKSAREGSRHKCAICGRTEEDDENLEFRFCSKCAGNYEYCMEHLFTHEHVRK